MKHRNRFVEESPTIMIIPMIDIMFFLLIFFMISTLYMSGEQQVPLSLPKTSQTNVTSVATVTVSLTKDGNVYVNQERQTQNSLVETLQEAVQNNPNTTFVIRADENIPYGQVVVMLNLLKESGATYVSIATDRL